MATENTTKGTTAARPTAAAKPTTTAAAAPRPIVKSRIGVFIDLENTHASLTNVEEILHLLEHIGQVSYGKFYGYADENIGTFGTLAKKYQFETAGKSRLKDHSHSVIDLSFVMDVLAISAKRLYDKVFVWLGKGELTPLFSKLRELKLHTITVDLPGFDSKNEFVSQTVRIFSPYGNPTGAAAPSGGGATVARAPIPMPFSPIAPRVVTPAPEPKITEEDLVKIIEQEEKEFFTPSDPADIMTKKEYDDFVMAKIADVLNRWDEIGPDKNDNKGSNDFDALITPLQASQVGTNSPFAKSSYDGGDDKALRDDRAPETDPYANPSFTSFQDDFGSINKHGN